MRLIYRLFDIESDSPEALAVFRKAYKDGLQAMAGPAPATLIWAIVTAVAMVSAGLSPFYVIMINLIVYASSAQLTVLSMLVTQGPLPIIWLAAAMVNLRFIIFSASFKPYFRHLKLPQRMLFGYLNGDINTMLFNFRYRNTTPAPATNEQKGFFMGIATVSFGGWQVGTVIGVLFSNFIPSTWGLELAASLTLFVLVIKGVEHWAGVVGCAVAAVVAVLLQNMPYKLWVLAAILAGVAVALVVEKIYPNGYLKYQPPKIKESNASNEVNQAAESNAAIDANQPVQAVQAAKEGV